jgi:hypothetical protein
MIGHVPRNEDFVPGFRFLTGGWGPPLFEPFGSSSKRVDLLMEVVKREGMTFLARDQHGDEHACLLRHHERPDLGKDGRRMGREILWADPLPAGPIQEIAALADVLLCSEYRNPAILLLCTAVEDDGTAVCALVHTAKRGGECDWRMDDATLPGETVGGAWFSEEEIRVAPGADRTHPALMLRPGRPFVPDRHKGPGPQWDPEPYRPVAGDLFAATRFRTGHELPVTLVSANLLRVAQDMDRKKVGSWLPVIAERPNQSWSVDLPLGSRMDLEMEMERAYARTQPDEIVVISVPRIDPAKAGEVHLSAMSNSGIKLHECDALDDHLYGTDLEPGVWIGEDVTWHDCGDDGAEWSADWRRATREDLARHRLSFDEVAENWTEYADLDTTAAEIESMVDRDVAAERAADAAAQSGDAIQGDAAKT